MSEQQQPAERVKVKLKAPVVQGGNAHNVGDTIEVTPAQQKRLKQQDII